MNKRAKPNLKFKDGSPVPTFKQWCAHVGDGFIAEGEKRFELIATSTDAQVIAQSAACLIGMHIAAHELGYTHPDMLRAQNSAIVSMTLDRYNALGIQSSVVAISELAKRAGQVH